MYQRLSEERETAERVLAAKHLNVTAYNPNLCVCCARTGTIMSDQTSKGDMLPIKQQKDSHQRSGAYKDVLKRKTAGICAHGSRVAGQKVPRREG